MYLGGQAGQRGYAMAALLVSVSIMAIIMTALLPVWKQQARREKEAELAFRGEQWARAIYLFTTKNGGQYPPNLDVLVQGRYVRKKYKDPMTEDGEWQPIFLGQQPQQQQGRGGQTGTGQGGVSGGAGRATGPGGGGSPPGTFGGGGFAGGQGGAGIATVQSKSKEASIRIYNGAGYYNQWQFRYNGRGRGGPGAGAPQPGAPQRGGQGAPGMPGSGGRGPATGQPGGRGAGQPGIGQPGGRGFGRGGGF
jgi:type II secretory pathway pseudopilin PulG